MRLETPQPDAAQTKGPDPFNAVVTAAGSTPTRPGRLEERPVAVVGWLEFRWTDRRVAATPSTRW